MSIIEWRYFDDDCRHHVEITADVEYDIDDDRPTVKHIDPHGLVTWLNGDIGIVGEWTEEQDLDAMRHVISKDIEKRSDTFRELCLEDNAKRLQARADGLDMADLRKAGW